MVNFNLYSVVCVISYLVFATMVSPVHSQKGKWNMDKSHDCELSDEQWNLIAWYFERVSYMEITQIVRNDHYHRRASRFCDYAIKKLFDLTNIEYETFIVDCNMPGGNVTAHTHTYTWHEEHFEPRHTLMMGNLSRDPYKTPWIQDTFDTARERFKTTYRVREDEPEFGSVVIADSIQLLDHYLNGEARHPFEGKRAHYVLIVHKAVNRTTWHEYASNVMAKMWKVHGILNAIILSSCNQENVGYYDPYINIELLNLTGIDKWGIYRCVPIEVFDLKDDWILRKEWSLNGFPFTATIFSRYPTMLMKRLLPATFLQTHYARGADYSNGFGGFDGFVVGNLARALNFRLEPLKRYPGETYGTVLPNNTFTGTLGDVLYGRAEASFNARFLLDYGTTEIEFMFPVLSDKMCVVAPAALEIPQWMAIFKCFSVSVWISFTLVTCLCGAFWFFLKKFKFAETPVRPTLIDINRTVFDERHHPLGGKLDEVNEKRRVILLGYLVKLHEALVPIWMVMLGATTVMPHRSMERFFIAACLLAHVIILGTFEGSLYTSFSTKSYYKNIDTLAELDKSGLPIVASSSSLRNLFGSNESDSPLLRSLNSKYRIESSKNVSAILHAAYKRDMCALERYLDIPSIIRTSYQRSDGSSLLHAVKECPRDYYLSYLVRKGWPLLPRFNNMLKRFAEGGFLGVWYEQTENAFELQSLIHQPIVESQDKKQAFTLKDMQTAFYILVIGYILCIFIFFVELLFPPPKKTRLPYIE